MFQLSCIMSACPDFRHYEFFGISEGNSVPENIKLNLYGSLTDERKNILKRDFLMENMVQGSGITKKTTLLIEQNRRSTISRTKWQQSRIFIMKNS